VQSLHRNCACVLDTGRLKRFLRSEDLYAVGALLHVPSECHNCSRPLVLCHSICIVLIVEHSRKGCDVQSNTSQISWCDPAWLMVLTERLFLTKEILANSTVEHWMHRKLCKMIGVGFLSVSPRLQPNLAGIFLSIWVADSTKNVQRASGVLDCM